MSIAQPVVTGTGPYALSRDAFRQSLAGSHRITVRAEVWRSNVKIGDVALIDGSISADRENSARRQASITVDPHASPVLPTDLLAPYGNELVIYRGVRYPDTTVVEYKVFTGRIDSVDIGPDSLSVKAVDRAQNLFDYAYLSPVGVGKGTRLIDAARNIILEVVPTATVTIDPALDVTPVVTGPTTFDSSRGDAVSVLCGALSADWFPGPDGNFYIAPVPVITKGIPPDWTIRTGDYGTIISYGQTLDRAGIYNGVAVSNDNSDTTKPIRATSYDLDPASPTFWNGPYGKVTLTQSGQLFVTTLQAQAAAANLLAKSKSATRELNVETVPDPSIMLDDIVQVYGTGTSRDGLYFVASFELPLGPDASMGVRLSSQVKTDTAFNITGWA